ncbi:hypothetical protein LZK98_02495 [Sphingomonas cannabina]|uniref:head-tail connector protein n=1 Tax=Sphingomonas cannabina TaxID=2899123 RepID=UPI001F302DED|nr:hypothetical protein [Sphingomonas cannabina]UIJ45848.1 hypothetical protein LZK98_02495 [Sphingomonas cannabina]
MTPPPFPAEAIAAARDAAKAHLRIASADEDALIETQAAAALALCESFTGAAMIAREWHETAPADGRWTRLAMGPVQGIAGVEGLADDGTAIVLPAEAYAVDIDAAGDGWVRAHRSAGEHRVAIRYLAGSGESWEALPAPVRQGVVLLAAHLFNARPGSAAPPAAIAALWRPFRRMRLSAERGRC